MFIRDLRECPEFKGGDDSLLRELFNPLKDELSLGYSLAFAWVPPGKSTRAHRLQYSEVYYLLCGQGQMTIDQETAKVIAHQLVYIPPGSLQHITNTGSEPLAFLCMVDPAWCPECEEVF